MTTPIKITDVALRDDHQSLIATRLRTEDMLPVCAELDALDYWSLEVWGGATFDACVRFLKEDPWERLRKLREALPNSQLQMLLRGQNLLGYRHYADDVVEAFIAKAADNGMDIFRIFDAMNDVRNLQTAIAAVKAAGKHAQGTICYTTSPVHTIEMWVEMAKEVADMGADSIAIKDMAGILKPYVAFDLVSRLKKELDIEPDVGKCGGHGHWVLPKGFAGSSDHVCVFFALCEAHPSQQPTFHLLDSISCGKEPGVNFPLTEFEAAKNGNEIACCTACRSHKQLLWMVAYHISEQGDYADFVPLRPRRTGPCAYGQ